MGCSGFRELNKNMHENLPNPSTNTTTTSNNMLPFHHHQTQVHHETSHGQQGSSSAKGHHDQLVPQRSSRWNPTPEQLLALEQLYRHAIKTPTAQQIRQITALLRHFGKIEGKNVFYWFQNHRARERQRRRRIMSLSQSDPKDHQPSITESAPAGSTRTSINQVEHMTKWTPISSCATTLSEQEASSRLVERAALMEGRGRAGAWIEYEERKVQQRMMNTLALINAHFPPQTSHPTLATDDQTLELFPLHSDNLKGVHNVHNITKAADSKIPSMITGTKNFMPSDQFFKFI